MKRWIVLFTLVVSVAYGITTAERCFGPQVVSTVAPASRLSYFLDSYDACREQFLAASNALMAKLPLAERRTVQRGKWKVPSKVDDNLFTDWIFLPAKRMPKSLIIITSGTHGVEGFTGSAIQKYLLDELLPTYDRDTTGIILIHAMNPYGFKYLRRVTENNVDLNRNLDVNGELFKFKNEGYAKLDSILNPTYPVRYDYPSGIAFFGHVAQALAVNSIATLRNATLQGQYQFPNGIYFGGTTFEPQKALYEKFLDEKAAPYSSVMHLDIHTGYGNRGHLHLFPSEVKDPKVLATMAKVFSEYKIDSGGEGDFYPNFGDVAIYTMNRMLQQHKRAVPMTLEFGTTNNLGTIGGVESLRMSVLENQLAHFGAVAPARSRQLKEDYLEQYYPKARDWRLATMNSSVQMIPLFMTRFSNLE